MAATQFVRVFNGTGCCCLATQPPTQKMDVVLQKSSKTCNPNRFRSLLSDIWEACLMSTETLYFWPKMPEL